MLLNIVAVAVVQILVVGIYNSFNGINKGGLGIQKRRGVTACLLQNEPASYSLQRS